MFPPFKRSINHNLFLVTAVIGLGKTEVLEKARVELDRASIGNPLRARDQRGGLTQHITEITTLKLRYVWFFKCLNKPCTTDDELV